MKPLTAAFHYRTRRRPRRRAGAARGGRGRRARRGLPHALGALVLEVLPPVDASKGTAVRALLSETGLAPRALRRRRHDRPRRVRALDGLELAVRVAIASAEGPCELGERADLVRRLTDGVPRAAEAALASSEPRRSRTSRDWRRATSSSVCSASASCEPEAVGAARRTPATFARLTRYERWMRANRRPEPLLELAERRRAEVGAVVGVHAAVVALGLRRSGPGPGRAAPCRRPRRPASSRPAAAFSCERSRRRSMTRASRSGSTGFSR